MSGAPACEPHDRKMVYDFEVQAFYCPVCSGLDLDRELEQPF